MRKWTKIKKPTTFLWFWQSLWQASPYLRQLLWRRRTLTMFPKTSSSSHIQGAQNFLELYGSATGITSIISTFVSRCWCNFLFQYEDLLEVLEDPRTWKTSLAAAMNPMIGSPYFAVLPPSRSNSAASSWPWCWVIFRSRQHFGRRSPFSTSTGIMNTKLLADCFNRGLAIYEQSKQ